MMDSPFMKLKYYLHAYWMGWKTRRLMALTKFQNLKNQVKEIEEFYGGRNVSGVPDHHVLKARENYVVALVNTIHR